MRTLALARGDRHDPDEAAISSAGLLRFPAAWLWTSRPIRYLLLGGALIIAAVAVATAIMVDNFRDRALADTERELKNTALILAGQIDRKFQAIELIQVSISERIQSLQIMSSEQFERQMSGLDVNRTLRDKISGLPYIDAIALINADGKLINFSRFWPVPVSGIADRDRFIALKSNPQLRSYIGEPVRSRTTGTWTVHLARKLSAPNGEFLGLVQGAVLLTDFEELFGSVILGSGSSITLSRSDGILLARHPRIEGIIGKTLTAAKEAIGTGNSGTLRFLGQIDGKDRIMAAHRIAHYPLNISVAIDTDAALAGWRKETRLLLGVGGFSTLAIAAMIILIVRQLSQRELLSRHRLVSEKQRLDITINSMTQGLLLFDASARLAVCNQRYIEMYGLSPDVVKTGCRFRDLIRHRQETGTFKGDVDEYCAAIIADLTLGKVNEAIVETVDGRSIQILSSPVATGGWVATHEDITERQRLLRMQRDAEELLRRQKLQLDAALNNMKHGLCMLDATGRIVLFNRHYADMIRLPESDLIDVSLLDLWRRRKASGQFARDPEQVFAALLADMQAGTPKTKVISTDGRELRVVDQPMADGGWVATIEDITEMRRAEEERNHNREFINQIIDNVPAAIIVKNVSDRRVAYINQATEKLWRIPRAAAIGKTAAELFPAACAEVINQTDDTILQSTAPIFVTERQMLPSITDGQSLISRKLVIRALDGTPKYLLSVIEDVTERKSIEAQLRQSQKMEAIGNLTGGVAHDFNNLLTVMIGNLDLLLEESTDNPQTEKMLGTVLEAALRGAELTKQMLAFSRRQPLRPKRVELSGLIDKTVRLLSRTLSEGISVDVHSSPDLCPIMVDEAQLEAALINIAINARDAMSHGGILTIATDKVLLKDEDAAHRPGLAAGEHVLLTITDTGIGMSAEVMNRIFEPFFTTKETGKGTGLGLSMVYGFVKQSGGYIGVTSTPGAGTTFELLFPTAASSADTGTKGTDSGKPRPTGEVVLAVDDQPEVRATAVAYLKSLGYRVLEADCAKAALKTLAAEANIDLLFTDIVMPGGINGIELASLARAQRPGLKVLYTSGYPGAGIVDGAQVDIEGCLLIKPYRKLELAAAITKVLIAA